MSEKPAVGDASAEPEEEETAELGSPGKAHYEGMTAAAADAVWAAETLCARCLHAPVCRIAAAAPETLTTVSRCVAYLPVPVGEG